MGMLSKRRAKSYNEQIRDAATDWFIRFCEDEVDESACKEFDAWLRTSPEHIRAYLEISAFWEAAGKMNRAAGVDVDELVRRAQQDGNVISFAEASGNESLPRQVPQRRRLAIAACALLASVALGTMTWWQLARYPAYATDVGELRTVTLQDGSVMQMSARTRVKVRFTDTLRGVELLQGQALFQVAHNTERPFIVESGSTRVRAVGTRFDVNREDGETVVTVVSGRVAVSTASAPLETMIVAPSDAVLLSAGEQVAVSPDMPPAPRKTDPAIATAWTEGKLVFDDTPMREVVRQFNRYSTRPLSIDDPQLMELHVTGTFRTDDSQQIVRFLSLRFGLVVHDAEDGISLSYE